MCKLGRETKAQKQYRQSIQQLAGVIYAAGAEARAVARPDNIPAHPAIGSQYQDAAGDRFEVYAVAIDSYVPQFVVALKRLDLPFAHPFQEVLQVFEMPDSETIGVYPSEGVYWVSHAFDRAQNAWRIAGKACSIDWFEALYEKIP